MAHAVKRIMFSTADTKKHLFVFVAKNPETGSEGVYSHVFLTAKKDQVSALWQWRYRYRLRACIVHVQFPCSNVYSRVGILL